MVGTVSFHWMSSFGAIDLSTSSCPKGYTILLRERKSLGLCQICLILIEIGRAGISSFRGQIGYVVQRSGLQCLIAIDLSTSSCPKGYTILLRGRKSLGLCQICLILIEIGRAGISSFRGQIGYVVQRSGLQCLIASTILGVLSKTQV